MPEAPKPRQRKQQDDAARPRLSIAARRCRARIRRRPATAPTETCARRLVVAAVRQEHADEKQHSAEDMRHDMHLGKAAGKWIVAPAGGEYPREPHNRQHHHGKIYCRRNCQSRRIMRAVNSNPARLVWPPQSRATNGSGMRPSGFRAVGPPAAHQAGNANQVVSQATGYPGVRS